ncbi:hypothetical protein PR202_gb16791 [Eleusine coracana subsp. coracana]|uniref:Uncharacterized protein n=1 Tax=Eleusine coracana subsp. coracana TaxID=191504 RepID=A0AAV5F0M9_ELECO|nr:hypothetical protein PR202_gb16734 [Eleusine coracana subsp. coracana]GJN28643.1 hypothetical protein PR202_gb16791 [Eleusine coracana subsp. coracana]
MEGSEGLTLMLKSSPYMVSYWQEQTHQCYITEWQKKLQQCLVCHLDQYKKIGTKVKVVDLKN